MKVASVPENRVPPSPFIFPPEAKQVKNLYDVRDLNLAITNCAFLAIDSFAGLSVNYFFTAAMAIPLFIAKLWQKISAYETAPQNTPSIVRGIAHPLHSTLFFWVPTLDRVQSVGALGGVAGNTIPKLYSCAKEIFKRPSHALTGMVVHSVNLAFQLFLARKAFQSGDGFLCGSSHPASHYANMSAQERVTSDLSPLCPADATKVLQVTAEAPCELEADRVSLLGFGLLNQTAHLQKIVNTCQKTCATGFSAWQKLKQQAGTNNATQSLLDQHHQTFVSRYMCI